MVPVWDGSPEDWEDYQIRSGIYCRGVDKWKVGQRISNLIQSLTGKAWDSITNLSESERENLQQDLPSFHAYLQQASLPQQQSLNWAEGLENGLSLSVSGKKLCEHTSGDIA